MTAEKDALMAVIRPSGRAMFHTQDCAHAKRAVSPVYMLAEDFTRHDVACSACRPHVSLPPASTSPEEGK